MKNLMTLLACGTLLISPGCAQLEEAVQCAFAAPGGLYLGTNLVNATTRPVCIRFDPDSTEPSQVIMPGQAVEFAGCRCGIGYGDKVPWYYFSRVADANINGEHVGYLSSDQPVNHYTLVYVLATDGYAYVVPNNMQNYILRGKKTNWERLRRLQPDGFPVHSHPQEDCP